MKSVPEDLTISTGSSYGSAPNKQQAITWTNNDQGFHQRPAFVLFDRIYG